VTENLAATGFPFPSEEEDDAATTGKGAKEGGVFLADCFFAGIALLAGVSLAAMTTGLLAEVGWAVDAGFAADVVLAADVALALGVALVVGVALATAAPFLVEAAGSGGASTRGVLAFDEDLLLDAAEGETGGIASE